MPLGLYKILFHFEALLHKTILCKHHLYCAMCNILQNITREAFTRMPQSSNHFHLRQLRGGVETWESLYIVGLTPCDLRGECEYTNIHIPDSWGLGEAPNGIYIISYFAAGEKHTINMNTNIPPRAARREAACTPLQDILPIFYCNKGDCRKK